MSIETIITIIASIFTLLFTIIGILIGVIYSRFTKQQQQQADDIVSHDKRLIMLEQAQKYEIESIIKELSDVKEEMKELRKAISKRDEVLLDLQKTLHNLIKERT
jgi:cbb3-type cytochrome oxidase subunit 3